MKKTPIENLGLSIIDSTASPDVTDLVDAGAGLLDGIINALSTGTLIEGIPVAGTIYKLFKTGVTVHEHLIVSKIARFLFQTGQIPLSERQAFLNEMNANPTYKRKVAENIVLLLDRADDMEKADVLGKLFGFYMSGAITYDLYRRYAGIVDKSHIPDLKRLLTVRDESYIEAPELSSIEIHALNALGLAGFPVIRAERTEVSTSLTELGKSLRKLLMTNN